MDTEDNHSTKELPFRENSLTTPSDRNLVDRWLPEQGKPKLTETEVSSAVSTLSQKAYLEKFPQFDRVYCDPPMAMQQFGLISFVPSRGATPDSNGIFGFAKLRGNFSTILESDERAEKIIRDVDSYNSIKHCVVGRPFPLTTSEDFSEVVNEIDIKKVATEEISSNIKAQRAKDKDQVDTINKREEALREDVSKEVDPYDEYITLRIKTAQLSWNYIEHIRKIKEIKELVIAARKTVAEMDVTYPEFQATYYKKYMDARKEAGIKESSEDADNFIKFLVQDVPLEGIDDVPSEAETFAETQVNEVSEQVSETRL
jgi:hypothetical protein